MGAERERHAARVRAVAGSALLVLGGAAAAIAGGVLSAVPAGLPPVPVPAGNELTPAKAALGEKLFFDPGLSADRTVSCATCHKPERYFADTTPLSKGIRGQDGERNASSVLNAAYAQHLLWDGSSVSLEDQVRYPVTHPLEMNNTQEKVVQYLAAEPGYKPLFAAAFGSDAVTWERVSQAVASFERTLLSAGSPFDRYMAGDSKALSEPARRGFELFRGRAGCVQCHLYDKEHPFFSDYEFHNTGVGWNGARDLGRYKISKAREDKAAFRTPSLRNVARTAPYMHDGQMATLPEVVAFYSRGGEPNPFLDAKLKPLELTSAEQADLVSFLESLTGEMTYQPAPSSR